MTRYPCVEQGRLGEKGASNVVVVTVHPIVHLAAAAVAPPLGAEEYVRSDHVLGPSRTSPHRRSLVEGPALPRPLYGPLSDGLGEDQDRSGRWLDRRDHVLVDISVPAVILTLA